MIHLDYRVGSKVIVIREKSKCKYVKGAESLSHEVPIGWVGTITRKGLTINGDFLYHDYDVIGEDGTEIHGYPSFCFMPLIPGTERDVINMVVKTPFGIDNEAERMEYITARQYLERTEDSLNISMMSIYLLGKAAGKREERAKKRKRSIENSRSEFIKILPNLESEISSLPDIAIEVLQDASKLSPERRAAFVAMIDKGEV